MSDNLHIIHEAPSQRRTHRLNAPITVVHDAMPYRTIDWSLLDFKIADYYGSLQQGHHINVIVQVPYQGFNVSFQASAVVAYHNESEHTLACEFANVDERGKEILETFVAGLVRGEMESIRGVIRRMDVPVTPASLKPDIALTETELKAQDRKRTLGSFLYLGAGICFLIALLTVFYTNFFQIKVESAVMAAPTDILIAPATGQIAKVLVKERQAVTAEEDIISFTDPELEQNIERAALHLKETGGQANTNTSSSETTAVRSSINALQQSLNVRAAALNRIKKMAAQGLAIRTDFERAEGEYFQAKAELSKAMERLNSLKSGSNTPQSSASVAAGELDLLKDQRARLTLKAPANGSIIHLMQREGTSVRYGDPIAIFEHTQPRYIEANLTREEALSVAIGDKATVYFPSHNHDVTFRVSDVDYASKLVSRREGMYIIEQAGLSRDVVVRLVLEGHEDAELINSITPGTSVVVVFSKIKWGENDFSKESAKTPSADSESEPVKQPAPSTEQSENPAQPTSDSVPLPTPIAQESESEPKAQMQPEKKEIKKAHPAKKNDSAAEKKHSSRQRTDNETLMNKRNSTVQMLQLPPESSANSAEGMPELPDMKLLDQAIQNAKQDQQEKQ